MNWEAYGAGLIGLASQARHRYLVTITGEHNWALNTCYKLVSGLSPIYIGDRPVARANIISPKDSRQLLGQEVQAIIYDLDEAIDPDSLGIVSGTVMAGGLLILIISESESDRLRDSRYVTRCLRLMEEPGLVVRIHQNASPLPINQMSRPQTLSTGEQSSDSSPAATPDQHNAIEAVIKVVSGQRKRPSILISDRGRGKSAALGLATNALWSRGTKRIIITGHNRRSVDSVFRHANPESGLSELRWESVDYLIQQRPDCELLLIDEAASIPLDQLTLLLQIYPRIAMATTVHGYEGTGRGFMLRFNQVLDKFTRGWRVCNLNQPIRWAQHDPLEAATNRLLMLDAELPNVVSSLSDPDECQIESIDSLTLANNETLLRKIFSLLVLAHYKTRPADLKQLLDNNALRIYHLVKHHNHSVVTIGVAIVVVEGQLELNTGLEILRGERRPAGQVLPEILSSQLGLAQSVGLKMGRVMRVVIHPEYQRKGLGSKLLQYISKDSASGFDILGANFSASPELARFWQHCGYCPIRIGLTQIPQSGANSIVYLFGVTPGGKSCCTMARGIFSKNFGDQLKTVLRDLDPELVAAIIENNSDFSPTLNPSELEDVASFCYTCRPAENIPVVLTKMAISGLNNGRLPNSDLVIERILQGRSWPDCKSLDGDQGKVDGISRLRHTFTNLLESSQSSFSQQYKQQILFPEGTKMKGHEDRSIQ